MDWFEILEKAKQICASKEKHGEEPVFTVREIEKAFGFKPGPETDSYHIASGWVGKLVRWRYVDRVGSKKNDGLKAIALYGITKKGDDAENNSRQAKTAGPKKDDSPDLLDLIEAVRELEAARVEHQKTLGKKSQKEAAEKEEDSFVALIKLCDEIEKKEYGVS